MIGKIVGALFGAEVQRRRGGSGAKGAAVGVAASLVAGAVMRRLGPIGLLAGGAYMAKKAIDRRREGDAAPPPVMPPAPPPATAEPPRGAPPAPAR